MRIVSRSTERSLWRAVKKTLLLLGFAATHQQEYEAWLKELLNGVTKRAEDPPGAALDLRLRRKKE